jgi:hypothetical protein
MRLHKSILLISSVCASSLGIVTPLASAQEAQDEQDHHSPHHVSVLIGGTHFQGGDSEFTLGFDYEYRVSSLLGIGAVAEHAFGSLDTWTYLAVADIHFEHLIVQVGPGVEQSPKHDLFTFRLGALYEFEFDGFTVSPQVHYDYHDGSSNAVIYGLAFGLSF